MYEFLFIALCVAVGYNLGWLAKKRSVENGSLVEHVSVDVSNWGDSKSVPTPLISKSGTEVTLDFDKEIDAWREFDLIVEWYDQRLSKERDGDSV